MQALDARLRELLGARVRSVALRRPDGGYDILRWRSSETRTIEPGAVSGVSRFTGRDIEADFRDRRAVTFKITPGRDDGIIVGLGLPAWVRSITMVPIHSDGGLSGFLPVLWESPRVPSIDELELLHGLADQTGLAFAQAQLQRARELAATDTLTDLVNHRSFQDLLRRQIRDAEAHAGRFAILFCDLDRFQELNDKHGHAVGDLVLHRVAGVLKAGARGRDVVARYGGDEIALILPDLDRVQAGEVAERLLAAVRSAEGGMGVDLTIGIASYPDDATEQAELLAGSMRQPTPASAAAGARSCRPSRSPPNRKVPGGPRRRQWSAMRSASERPVGGWPVRAVRASRRRSDSWVKRTPSQRNGSGSQLGERWLTRGSAVSSDCSPGSGRPGPVRRGWPSTPRDRCSRARTRSRSGDRTRTSDPVPGHAQGAAPGVSEADPAQAGEPGLDQRPEQLVGRGVTIEGGLDRRAEAIRCAAAAEQDPPIGGPRQVVDRQAVGRHDLAGPADRGPVRIRNGLGQDDERIERQEGRW